MSRYSKIERRILNDQKFNGLSDEGKLVFLILLIHPHLTALGAMRATPEGLASELRWSADRFQKAFREAFQKGMVKYDEQACFVWLPNYLKHNRPESPNVVKSWGQSLEYLPECALKNELIQQVKTFVAMLSEPFQEALPDSFLKPYESLSEDLPESLTEAVTVTEAVTEEQRTVELTPPDSSLSSAVQQIFEHWKKTFNHPGAILDEKRKRLIKQSLKMGYAVTKICEAITGCSLTPYNMGENERGQRYEGLHVILRDADQIDRFIRNYHNPPVPANSCNRLLQTNQRAAANWLAQHSTIEESMHEIQ